MDMILSFYHHVFLTSSHKISSQHILKEAGRDRFVCVGYGLFAQVVRVVGTKIALKIPDEPGEADAIEKRIYERLGTHPFILQTYGEGDSVIGRGLVLQYMSAGELKRNLDLENYPIARKHWPFEAVDGVAYIHSKNIVHCDIGAHNFFIQDNGSLALADFCGSSIDGSENIVAPSTRYARPLSVAERLLRLNEKDDIFALGTILYEISVGHQLYAEKSDNEVHELFQRHEFPDLSAIDARLGTAIERCRKGKYNTVEETKSDLSEYATVFKHFDHHSTYQNLLQWFGVSSGLLLVVMVLFNRRRSLK